MDIHEFKRRHGWRLRTAWEWIQAIGAAVVVGLIVFFYVSYLQEHGCVIGTTCISITR